MHLRNLALVLPLAALAACGGSGSREEGATVSESAPASVTAESTPPVTATAEAPAEFAICRSCHSPEKGRNGVGPSLFAIVGSKAGDVPGYAFSPALKASGIVWTRETLDTWLQGPMKMVPGTKMVIAVPDPARRKVIIDYLEALK